jgi:hypothetical protein
LITCFASKCLKHIVFPKHLSQMWTCGSRASCRPFQPFALSAIASVTDGVNTNIFVWEVCAIQSMSVRGLCGSNVRQVWPELLCFLLLSYYLVCRHNRTLSIDCCGVLTFSEHEYRLSVQSSSKHYPDKPSQLNKQ